MPAEDRELVRKLVMVVGFLFALASAYAGLDRLYSRKFSTRSGRAVWIWPQHDVASNVPVAFFAVRELSLPAGRLFTKVKIAADPEYIFWFNGNEVGGRRTEEESSLDVYDVSTLAHTGDNRIVIGVRSANGVGGLLAAVDIGPEAENYVVTDGSWRIYRRWDPTLPVADRVGALAESPQQFGAPPSGRWNYPVEGPGRFEPEVHTVVPSRSMFSVKTALAETRVVEGVAIRVQKPERASVYDFGFIDGRLRLTIDYDNGASRIVNVRLTNTRDELFPLDGPVRPYVFAPGEWTITAPEASHFRYAMVYGARAKAEVVR